jgi:hypothetical protein
MPGLNQLKQFSKDIKNLGDEVNIRAQRGEKPAEVPIPEGISAADDSEDFVLGMPEQEKPAAAASETFDLPEQPAETPAVPDLDAVLNPVVGSSDDLPDLSDFLTPPESAEPPDASTPLEDLDLDSLLQGSTEAPAVPSEETGAADDFSFDGNAIDLNENLPADIAESAPEFAEPAVPELGELDSVPESDGETVEVPPDAPVPDDLSVFDTSMLDPQPQTDATQDVVPEIFDTSEMDGLDFSSEAPLSTGFQPPDISEITGGDDFQLATGEDAFDTDFEIPGFSDTPAAKVDKRGHSIAVGTPDFSKAAAGHPKNTLTDDEYRQFKKNLAAYPLNLRVAIEDLIVKNEFTDEAVFEVIEKVVKKTPARQVAAHIEKMLDITINVPRDYERRSVAQYEEYKGSFEYQLKNRILPALVAALALGFICYALFVFGDYFLYRPVKAEILYRQGYALIEQNAYSQSGIKFKEAVSYRPVKKWFFKYAEGYRSHKQYERAAQMYRNILGIFNFDKQAGLDYARMELYDRANYEKAEEIIRRDVLDHYVNDKDGILALGDVFLEWGSVDPSKYEAAREQYATLIQLYGQTDLYLSRMMRYFIRTDKLRNVLELKSHFYPVKKSLGGDDWIELGGYLLDKLYGKLSSSDEYLRSSIEDVRDILERGIKLSPQNPVGHYNLARYFIHTDNAGGARSELQQSLTLFDHSSVRTRPNTYREINAARLLGELYANDREYLKAQSVYTKGVDLFEKENRENGFQGTPDIGKLYSDIGDIDYFISGDLDTARRNYETAVQTQNDTPSLRYRIGAVYYNQSDYTNALDSFVKTVESKSNDTNVLLAMGNVLSQRGDNFAAQGYYEELLNRLDIEKGRRVLLHPDKKTEDSDLLDMYVNAANNLGVTLYRLARQTGNSSMNAESLVRLSESIRAWDALTRDQKTMKRMDGSNLAAQNTKYITHPMPDYEPAIYTDIPRTLSGEKGLEQ